jgi:hypothetical protein
MTELDTALSRADHGVLDVERMDFTVLHPEQVRSELGHVFQFAARTESEVARDAATVHALLPSLDPQHARFVDEVWLPQETQHGIALDRLLGELSLPLPATNLEVPASMHRYGKIAKLSGDFHDILFNLYTLRGTAHEATTAKAYNQQIKFLTELGETALTDTVFGPISRDEGPHLSMYKAMFKESFDRMSTWKKWITRRIFAATYTPVGTSAARDARRPDMGAVALTLAGDDGVDEFMGPTVKVLRNITQDGKDIIPRAVLRSVHECIEEARAQQAQASSPEQPFKIS